MSFGNVLGQQSNTAANISYNNQSSGLSAENVQAAIDELATDYTTTYTGNIIGIVNDTTLVKNYQDTVLGVANSSASEGKDLQVTTP